MKLWTVAVLLSVAVTTVKSQNLVVFGDSLSDSGYGSYRIQLTLNTSDVYPAPPYWKGRYSDGPTWVEGVAAGLGTPLYNYAIGGASTGATPATSSPLLPPFAGLKEPYPYQAPNLGQQVEFYLADHNGAANPDDVYVIESANNDIILLVAGAANATISDIATTLEDAVEDLYQAGARKFVIVANSRIVAPAFNTDEALRTSSLLSADLFLALATYTSSLPNNLPGVTAQLFNFGGALVEIFGNATQRGITNTTMCYQPVKVEIGTAVFSDLGIQSGYICPDPTQHDSFDEFHPTSTVHNGVAKAFLRDTAPFFWSNIQGSPALAPAGVPNGATSPTAAAG